MKYLYFIKEASVLNKPLLFWVSIHVEPNSNYIDSSLGTAQICTKYWSFSFSIIPSKEIPGLISVRMDWLDLLAVQGTLKSLLQCHSSKASWLSSKSWQSTTWKRMVTRTKRCWHRDLIPPAFRTMTNKFLLFISLDR